MTWNARPIRYLYTLNKTSLMLSCLRFVRAELILIRSLSGYKQASKGQSNLTFKSSPSHYTLNQLH